MKAHIEFITVPSHDNSSTCLLLHLDERRYIFGHISEGTQRLVTQNVIKMQRVSNIFLSGKTEWKTNGGLIGLLLTIGDAIINRQALMAASQAKNPEKEKKYMILGPDGKEVNPYPPPPEPDCMMIRGGRNLLNTMATARNFVFREGTGFHFEEYDFTKSDCTFKDDFVTVKPLRAFPRVGGGLVKTTEEIQLQELEDADLGSRPDLEKLVEAMWNGRPGSLKVEKEDEDYVSALLARLKEDDARQKATQPVREDGGESPPKRMKLDHEPKNEAEEPWDDIFEDQESKSNSNAAAATGSTAGSTQSGRVPVFPKERPLRRPWPATMMKSLPGTLPSVSVMSYITSIHGVRGKFLVAKAKALGVTPGPDFRKLAEGESISLPDGTIVHSHQCMEPPRVIPGLAFLDIPDETYIEGTLENLEKWKKTTLEDGGNASIGIWVWALGSGLEEHPRLKEYMKLQEGKHLVTSPSSRSDNMSFRDSSAQMARLNLLSKDNFPLPCPSFDYVSPASPPKPYSETDKFLEVRESLTLDIHPKPAINEWKIPARFDVMKVQEEAKSEVGNGKYWESIQQVNETISQEEASRNAESSDVGDVEVITLGTGSALPSKYRNVSANLISIPGYGHMLLDSGESTANQLARTFSPADLVEMYQNLRVLYISHLHADHHLGTPYVLKNWYLANHGISFKNGNLFLLAPAKYLNFLEEYSQIEDFGLQYIKFIPNEHFLTNEATKPQLRPEQQSRIKEILSTNHLSKIETAPAVHCRDSFTVAFTFSDPSGLKIAYSGDTRPTSAFVKIGKDATVLIHEATFDDELAYEAQAKRHCTTSEAITAGRNMRAKNLLLTHFSQRYPKLPSIQSQSGTSSRDEAPLCDPFMETPEGKEADYSEPIGNDDINVKSIPHDGPAVSKPVGSNPMNIAFAFDIMRVKLKDFWKLEKHIPALEVLFNVEEKLDEDLAPTEGTKAGGNTDKSKANGKQKGNNGPSGEKRKLNQTNKQSSSGKPQKPQKQTT